MKNRVFVLVVLIFALGLVGCASSVPRMKAETRADVVGEAVVMEETVTTAADGTVTRTIKTTRKTAPAVDQELKEAELRGRTAVGVAKATPKDPCASWILAPSYCYQGGGRYGSRGGYYTGNGGVNTSYGSRSGRSRSVNNGGGGSNTSYGGGEGVSTRPPTGGNSGGSNTTGRGH